MWKNTLFIGVVITILCVSFVSARPGGGEKDAVQIPSAFEGRFELRGPLAVGIAAGTVDYPELARIEYIRFDTSYGNAWGVTARVGWLPVKETTWRLTVELLDEAGHILRHSRDDPMVFTCKAGKPYQSNMRYADLNMGAMHDQGRRHAARFRVRLAPSEEHVMGENAHTLEVAVVDRDSKEPISDATVVIGSSYQQNTIRRYKTLYCTDSQGCCRIRLARDGLVLVGIEAQKQDYCTVHKSWSNYSSSALGRAPIVNLPQRHVLEMIRASALGGIVQDMKGNPIEGAEARIEARSEELSGTIDVDLSVLTDANGYWRIDGIPREAERITLRLKHPEYGGNKGRYQRIASQALVNARAFKHVETLDKGLMITGKVLDEQGQPISDATIILTIQSSRLASALTDASGAFRLACSSDRSDYREIPFLIVEAPGYAPTQQNIDIQPAPESLEFHLKRGRNIACRVVDTKGLPVAGAWTVIEPLEGNRYYSVWLNDTDDRGEFQIPNVPENEIKLTVGKQGYITIRDHIVPASNYEVVVTMKHAMRVYGTVTDDETGKSIPNFEIAAVYAIGSRTNTSRPVAFAEGIYELSFDGARPENRQLMVSAVGYEAVTSDQINIDEGEREINFKMARSTSFNEATAGQPREQVRPSGQRRITGIVRDGQGKPLPDAIVVTYPRMGAETVTNAKGAFTLKSRGTQGYIGTMREDEITYLMARQKDRNLATAMLLDTSTDTVNVTLAPGAILSGKVVDVEGKGIPSAELSLTFWISSIGYGSREITEIDKSGYYEIRGVPVGYRYSVNDSADGYGTRYTEVNTGGAENQRLEVEPLVLSVANLSTSGIVVDEFDQPIPGLRIYAYGNGQPTRETFTDTKGRFTIENVCPGQINIQANSQRRATRRFRGRAQAEGGTTDIRIVVDELDESGRRVPRQPPSLVGKELPDIKELGIDTLPSDITGKKILVCFWDMQQRPSRRCITQLVKQGEQLKDKGITVIALQASKIEQEILNQWIKKYNIPFPVGMVRGDVEKTRFTWGVKSLPWLILTDNKHVIINEGFGIAEIGDILE